MLPKNTTKHDLTIRSLRFPKKTRNHPPPPFDTVFDWVTLSSEHFHVNKPVTEYLDK